jgi:hypothetical protein
MALWGCNTGRRGAFRFLCAPCLEVYNGVPQHSEHRSGL